MSSQTKNSCSHVLADPQSDDWQVEYPFESRYLPLEGGRLHYVDEGAGQPLLMVHGNPTWSFYYRHLIREFRCSHRAVAPDHIGCGLSDKPRHYNYRMAQHADNLLHLIEHLDLRRIVLIVHDWGGAIGLRAACAVPERFERIVLLNTGAFPPPYVPWRIGVCRTPLVGAVALQGLNLFALAATRMALHCPSRMSVRAKSGMLAPYDSWDHRRAIYRFVQDIPTNSSHPTWDDLVQLERNLHVLADLPTCMIWGMQDWCFRPSCLTRLRDHFPAAIVHELSDVGHWVLEEAPERVATYLSGFLRTPAVPLPRSVRDGAPL
ncbi:MAG: alpha/beta fold hydrolase [Planctomycetota bacterium]|nr:alpha/beta fold hydrolase [Planctomycetota bacterium]